MSLKIVTKEPMEIDMQMQKFKKGDFLIINPDMNGCLDDYRIAQTR